MKCPVCNVDLAMADRQGIEIDYCPQCRGVWLDRGELDKIVERSAQYETGSRGDAAASAAGPQASDRRDERVERGDHERDRRHDEHKHDDYRRKKKPGSFLTDLFEGFGD